jgi:hypothetical protein
MNPPPLSFDDKTIDLLLDRDMKYFIEKDLNSGRYHQDQVSLLHVSYADELGICLKEIKKDKKQYRHHLYGAVMIMWSGGFLPALFRLDGWTRRFSITDFEGAGRDWARFTIWQTYARRKRTSKRLWNYVTKVGSVLGIGLTIVKLWELLYA